MVFDEKLIFEIVMQLIYCKLKTQCEECADDACRYQMIKRAWKIRDRFITMDDD